METFFELYYKKCHSGAKYAHTYGSYMHISYTYWHVVNIKYVLIRKHLLYRNIQECITCGIWTSELMILFMVWLLSVIGKNNCTQYFPEVIFYLNSQTTLSVLSPCSILEVSTCFWALPTPLSLVFQDLRNFCIFTNQNGQLIQKQKESFTTVQKSWYFTASASVCIYNGQIQATEAMNVYSLHYSLLKYSVHTYLSIHKFCCPVVSLSNSFKDILTAVS